MAYSYKPVDRDQLFLLPPDMREWLPKSHLAWFVLDVVEHLDTSALHVGHPNDGVGRQAYDPDMLLALLIYAYCTGVRSSRAIERLCGVDVAYRVIAANHVPDHTTIARFRQGYDAVAQQLFVGALALCAEAGLAKVGVVAIDGTKLAANASLKANRTRAQIEAEVAEMFCQAQAKDSEEDRLLGEGRGDELPEGLADPRTRAARLDAALRELEAQEAARRAEEEAARARADEAAGAGRPGRPRAGEALAKAEADLEKLGEELGGRLARAEAELALALEEAEAAEAAKLTASGKKMGRPPKTPGGRRARRAAAKRDRLVALAERRRRHAQARVDKEKHRARARAEAQAKRQELEANVTDPDSRIMKTPKGWVQGYNAQVAVSKDGIVLAAEVTQDHNDSGQAQPMMASVAEALAGAGIEEAIGTLLFDAGYLSEENLAAPGPDRLIATAKSWRMRREAKQNGYATGGPPEGASLAEAMEHRLS